VVCEIVGATLGIYLGWLLGRCDWRRRHFQRR
jgi:hypothetical protein